MSEYSLKLIIEQGIRVLLKISLQCLWNHWRLILYNKIARIIPFYHFETVEFKEFFSYFSHQTPLFPAKNQFAMFMESLAFNLKRMVILNEEYGF
jgi:hypothetical protein